MSCKGSCSSYKHRKYTRNAFREGFIRCRQCDYFIKTDDLRCKCCNGVFARHPRKKHTVEHLRH
jgi:hypothetical protein